MNISRGLFITGSDLIQSICQIQSYTCNIEQLIAFKILHEYNQAF